MPVKTIPVNGPYIEVMPRAEEPMRMTMRAAATTSESGEEIEVLNMLGNPFVIVLRGEKLACTIDISSVVQEALLHTIRENAE